MTFLHIGAEFAEMTLYQSEQNLPRCPCTNLSRLISLYTYFMVAGALTKNCFHRILRYLSSFASSSMPSCSTDVSLHHTNTTPRVYTLPWPNQPLHQAPLRRLKTSSLLKSWRYQWLVICRPLLSNEYWSEETSHKASWHPPGMLHYRPVTSLYPILCLQCTIASRTPTVHEGQLQFASSHMHPCRMGGTVYLPLLYCLSAWYLELTLFTITLHIFCWSTRFYPLPVSHGGEWFILCYALLCPINLHTDFRHSYVCYFLIVWPLVSMGESD